MRIFEDVPIAAGPERFSLFLKALPIDMMAAPGNLQVRLLVHAPLRFEANYPIERFPFRIKRTVTLAGGRVQLGAGSMPQVAGVRGEQMDLSLKPTYGVEFAEPLLVPCSELDVGDFRILTPGVMMPIVAHPVGTGSGFVPLYAKAGVGTPLLVKYPGEFAVLARKAGWVQLSARWDDDSTIHGWTLETFATAKAGEVVRPGRMMGGGCGGALDAILAKFTVRKGAPIAASPGGAVWATMAENFTVEAYPLERSDGWVQIARVPGSPDPVSPCDEHEHLWVHVQHIVWTLDR